MKLLILLLTVAWCGGMSAGFCLMRWRDGEPWKADAGYAAFALAMLFALWSF